MCYPPLLLYLQYHQHLHHHNNHNHHHHHHQQHHHQLTKHLPLQRQLLLRCRPPFQPDVTRCRPRRLKTCWMIDRSAWVRSSGHHRASTTAGRQCSWDDWTSTSATSRTRARRRSRRLTSAGKESTTELWLVVRINPHLPAHGQYVSASRNTITNRCFIKTIRNGKTRTHQEMR